MFHPLAQKIIKDIVQFLPANFSIVDLGNQRFGNKDGTFKEEGTKQYYEALGASSYIAIDVNERMDAVIADLNYDVVLQINPQDHADPRFNLVMNNGTSEHLFNQAQVFKNIHELCTPNGIMLHILPLFVWLNHGFYNYNPVFFRDLSRANDYEIISFGLFNRWGDGENIQDFDELFKEKNPDKLFEIIKKVYSAAPIHHDVFNVCCFKKRSNQSFKFPLQGKYKKDVEGKIKSI